MDLEQKTPKTKTEPDEEEQFKEFQRLVLTAMGLPVTVGGLKIASGRGVNFQELWEGGQRCPQRIAYCWRDVYGKIDPTCDSEPCVGCTRTLEVPA
jgi:hypothetical protein